MARLVRHQTYSYFHIYIASLLFDYHHIMLVDVRGTGVITCLQLLNNNKMVWSLDYQSVRSHNHYTVQHAASK